MTQDLVLTAVERPSRFALQEAIACFEDDAPNKGPEELTSAMLAIVGEACFLLGDGKTREATISELKLSGLSEECSKPFVEKAVQIVEWNQRAQADSGKSGKAWLIAAGAVVLCLVLAFLFASG